MFVLLQPRWGLALALGVAVGVLGGGTLWWSRRSHSVRESSRERVVRGLRDRFDVAEATRRLSEFDAEAAQKSSVGQELFWRIVARAPWISPRERRERSTRLREDIDRAVVTEWHRGQAMRRTGWRNLKVLKGSPRSLLTLSYGEASGRLTPSPYGDGRRMVFEGRTSDGSRFEIRYNSLPPAPENLSPQEIEIYYNTPKDGARTKPTSIEFSLALYDLKSGTVALRHLGFASPNAKTLDRESGRSDTFEPGSVSIGSGYEVSEIRWAPGFIDAIYVAPSIGRKPPTSLSGPPADSTAGPEENVEGL